MPPAGRSMPFHRMLFMGTWAAWAYATSWTFNALPSSVQQLCSLSHALHQLLSEATFGQTQASYTYLKQQIKKSPHTSVTPFAEGIGAPGHSCHTLMVPLDKAHITPHARLYGCSSASCLSSHLSASCVCSGAMWCTAIVGSFIADLGLKQRGWTQRGSREKSCRLQGMGSRGHSRACVHMSSETLKWNWMNRGLKGYRGVQWQSGCCLGHTSQSGRKVVAGNICLQQCQRQQKGERLGRQSCKLPAICEQHTYCWCNDFAPWRRPTFSVQPCSREVPAVVESVLDYAKLDYAIETI